MYYHHSTISLYPSKRLAYTTGGLEKYVGHAVAGSLEEDPVWVIMLLEYNLQDKLIAVKFPEGNSNYNFVWNDRETYNYS